MPLLTKEYVRRHQSELLANGIDTRQVDDVATGGTSGAPLTFRIQRDRSAVEWAFMTWQWKRIGFRLGDRRVVLRGTQIDGAAAGAISQENPLLDELALSTFALSAANLGQYLETIQEYGPAFLHAYPSSAETLARLLSQTSGLARPRFRGILLGSENLYPSQIDLISQTFATPLFSWYGHSEKCLLGGWCEHTRDFHMFSQYGYLEVLTENGEPCAPGERGVLVGTGFINRVMPFLRYVTDDTAILTDDPCPCGLPYPRVRDVIGRWHGEKLYGTAGRTFTMTALNTHSPVFNRVAQFRLVQERVGEAIVEVVGTEEYTPADSQAIAGEYMNRCGGAISFTVRVVSELPRTRAGKFKFVDQRIPEG
jgi:phenylacetate-CoA ligase